jgi:hypothetical protein
MPPTGRRRGGQPGHRGARVRWSPQARSTRSRTTIPLIAATVHGVDPMWSCWLFSTSVVTARPGPNRRGLQCPLARAIATHAPHDRFGEHGLRDPSRACSRLAEYAKAMGVGVHALNDALVEDYLQVHRCREGRWCHRHVMAYLKRGVVTGSFGRRGSAGPGWSSSTRGSPDHRGIADGRAALHGIHIAPFLKDIDRIGSSKGPRMVKSIEFRDPPSETAAGAGKMNTRGP